MKEEITGNWASHIPALLSCVSLTRGPVLELGMGHFSTPILHSFCRANNMRLTSVEESLEWARQFSHLQSPLHSIRVSGYDAAIASFGKTRFGVTFIDESPGGERRAKSFRAMLPNSTYVVVHDYWRDNEEAIAPLLTGVPHLVYSQYNPPTLVASLDASLPDL